MISAIRKTLTVMTLSAIIAVCSIQYTFSQPELPDKSSLLYEKEYLDKQKSDFISDNGNLVISSVIVTGNIKTRESLILRAVGNIEGKFLTDFSPYDAVNRLNGRGIFSYINITYMKDENNEVIIGVHVKEKVTLIPIPMYIDNGHSTTYGLFVMENNFLGLNKRIFIGGMYSTLSKSFMGGYTDDSFLGSNFNYNIFSSYANSEIETGDQEERLFQKYRSESINLSMGFGYYISRYVNLRIINGYRSSEIDGEYKENLNEPGSGEKIFSGCQIVINRMRYNEFLNFGIRGKVDVSENFTLEDPDSETDKHYTTSKITAEYSHKILKSNKLRFFISGAAGDQPVIFQDRIGSREGFQTLPGDIIASDWYLGSKTSYEIPVTKFSWGFATVLAFWEQGTFKNAADENMAYYGPGAGLRLYLKRVAIPAIGFNYARNMKTGLNQLSFSVGFGI